MQLSVPMDLIATVGRETIRRIGEHSIEPDWFIHSYFYNWRELRYANEHDAEHELYNEVSEWLEEYFFERYDVDLVNSSAGLRDELTEMMCKGLLRVYDELEPTLGPLMRDTFAQDEYRDPVHVDPFVEEDRVIINVREFDDVD